MFCQRAVAGLAVHTLVCSLAFNLEHIGMAKLARLVSRKRHRSGGDFLDGVSPVVTILAKARWHENCPCKDDREGPDSKNEGKAKQVFGVFEFTHECAFWAALARVAPEAACDIAYAGIWADGDAGRHSGM